MIEVVFTILLALSLITGCVLGVRRSLATGRSLAGLRALNTILVAILSIVMGGFLFFTNPVNWQVAAPFWKICASNGAIVIITLTTIAVSTRAIWRPRP